MDLIFGWMMITVLITAITFYALGHSAGQRTYILNRRALAAAREKLRRTQP